MNAPRMLLRLLLGQRMPTTSGTLHVQALHKPVIIRRDGYSIPYIEAETEDDAWYALGFCQGQDRDFHIEILARAAQGTLSEMAGKKGLPQDRLSRRMGLGHCARLQFETLSPEVRRNIESFALGVTEGARIGCKKKAHEYTLLRRTPTPLSAIDVIAIFKLLSFALASNWDIELARLHILLSDGPDSLCALDPDYPDWQPVSLPPCASAGRAIDRLGEDIGLASQTIRTGGGSNNWAISPANTSTGRPILSNDPHLSPSLPPYWYLAQVRTPQWSIAGAVFTGTPGFAIGHNGTVAWGITAGFADNTDMFLEEIGPDGCSVRERDGFIQCKIRREVIHVRGGEDQIEDVIITNRGPIVSPAIGTEIGAVSMRATWLEARPLKGFLVLHKARSVTEVREAFRQWPAMSLNIVAADTAGSIAWQLVGDVPRRNKGWGTVPQPGCEAGTPWEDGTVPFEEMPSAQDPPSGILATANNMPIPNGTGPYLGYDWIDGYRFSRILDMLKDRKDWSIESSQKLQMDLASVPWRELRERVLGIQVQQKDARLAISILRDWDGNLDSNSTGASVFELFIAVLSCSIARSKAPGSWEWAIGRGPSIFHAQTALAGRRVGHLVSLITRQPDGFFAVPWEAAIEEALASAVKQLKNRCGDNLDNWKWGKIRKLTLYHTTSIKGPLAKIWTLGPYPWGGDANTVSQAAVDPMNPLGNPLVIASLRMTLDVGNWDDNRFSLPGGQSGNPLSPHYSDMLELWLKGEGACIPWSRIEILKSTRTVLRLTPDP